MHHLELPEHKQHQDPEDNHAVSESVDEDETKMCSGAADDFMVRLHAPQSESPTDSETTDDF